MVRVALVLLAAGIFITPGAAEDKPRNALAMKVDLNGDSAKLTVAFNYDGKQGDAPTFEGVRLYRYDVKDDKEPVHVGWNGKEREQSVVLAGRKYAYTPTDLDRQENGTIAVSKVPGGKIRLTGVYYAYGQLFAVDEVLAPGSPVLLEERAGSK
jgi:hypothetical protein